jgi:hypothetical protein
VIQPRTGDRTATTFPQSPSSPDLATRIYTSPAPAAVRKLASGIRMSRRARREFPGPSAPLHTLGARRLTQPVGRRRGMSRGRLGAVRLRVPRVLRAPTAHSVSSQPRRSRPYSGSSGHGAGARVAPAQRAIRGLYLPGTKTQRVLTVT